MSLALYSSFDWLEELQTYYAEVSEGVVNTHSSPSLYWNCEPSALALVPSYLEKHIEESIMAIRLVQRALLWRYG
jgi:uncharacterized protein YvpB